MRISYRVLTGFLLVAAAATYFLISTFLKEVRPGPRQGLEVAMLETGQILAGLALQDLETGQVQDGRLARSLNPGRRQPFKAEIHGFPFEGDQLGAYLTDAQGRLLYDSSGRSPGEDISRWNDVYRTLRGKYGARSTRLDPKDPSTSVMHVAVPVRKEKELLGVLTVYRPTSDLMPLVERAERRVRRGGLILILLATGSGLILSGWLTRSLNRLRGYAKEVSEGRKASLPELGNSEWKELGKALESMREKLEGREYLERYVHALTHEMKSPLSVIRSSAELLEEDMSPQDRCRFLGHIQEQEERLRLLVDRMLELATLQHRRDLDKLQELDLAALLQELLKTRSLRLEQLELQLQVLLPSEAPLQGERLLLEQAVSNILDNALDFSPEGSQLRIHLEREGGQWRLQILDEGPGIPEFARDKVLEPFFSLPRPRSGKKGTGLGLSFVREIAQLHGGSFSLENRATGGAEASLKLPMSQGTHP